MTLTRERPAPPGPHRPRVPGRDQLAGWGFVTPATVLVGVFGLAPILWSFVLSFQRANLLTPQKAFIGVANYRAMLHDPVIGTAIEHTVVYTALFVPLTMAVGLGLAVAMNRDLRFISFYRTAAYVTMAVSTINEALIFMWLFDPAYGLIDSFLQAVGIAPQPWLNSPSEALYVIVAMTVWGWTGFAVIVYLAALQGVPKDLMDAASVDGASTWARFRRITVPLLSPASLFLAVWLTINALQLFDEVYLSTHGGPLNATVVVVYYVWQQAFQNFNAGYAAAIAYVLFLLILVVTAVQFRVGRRYTYYRS